MKFDETFPSKWLRAADIERPVHVRIKDVAMQLVGPEQEAKPVCAFTDTLKPLILNRTNFAALISITGSEDSDDWAGRQVEVYTETILMRGQRTPSLRIRAARGAEEQADDIPDSWEDEPPVTAGKKRKSA